MEVLFLDEPEKITMVMISEAKKVAAIRPMIRKLGFIRPDGSDEYRDSVSLLAADRLSAGFGNLSVALRPEGFSVSGFISGKSSTVFCSLFPHSPQNLLLSGIFLPQFGQNTVLHSFVVSSLHRRSGTGLLKEIV